ncbi:biosynthetic-type acetolactate synthase large subunit [Paenibacillus sp. N3/727]|uniref:biosynthetic-type acetolactate synthase large subunit n=1 Tax=Paenibacillus sp. N3/727 TaxID=2925845 RepID=UPI001F5311F3|nr:biosynthetic-type acetolactate synthase large subunit [Paenibacillus sp. N3/727]UNK16256.1 biosynthetic-type acetolactate synthase large subunit [Paenibacillus sp. N3/727]
MTGAELLIELLLENDVDTIFGYPGGAVLPIYDALYDNPSIRHILVRHEQAAVHAADGYARVSGKPGVSLVTSGPGATNAITGIANGYMDSVPMVVLTGQVPTQMIGRDSFQEVDIFGMTMSITKHNFMVFHIDDLPGIINSAFHIATTGRPGPVLIDLPKDVMTAQTGDTNTPMRSNFTTHLLDKNPCQTDIPVEQLKLIFDKLTMAKRPAVVIGGGCMAGETPKLLLQLMRKAKLPVVSTLMGLGAFPSQHPLHLGMLGMHGTVAANRTVQQADVLLCLGVRFSDRVAGNRQAFSPRSYKIQVDVEEAELNKNIDIDLAVHGTTETVIKGLLERNLSGSWTDWNNQISHLSKRVPSLPAAENRMLQPQDVIRLVHRQSSENAIIATDVGQHQIWTAHHYPFSQPRTFVTSGGLGTMGFGLPAAIGAAIACPDREVVCISGDGSIQMNIQELMTAVDQNLNIKVIILTNGYLGMVRQWQQLFHKKRYSSVKISSPVFPELAKTFGAFGYHADNLSEAEKVIEQAWKEEGVIVMEFDITEEMNVYPMIPPGATSAETIED